MGMFGNIMHAIFGHGASAAPGGAAPAPSSSGSSSAAAPAGSGSTASSSSAASTASGTAQNVDVGAVMDGLASQSKEKLNWKTSIVDLMKLLKLDSSLQARKELAKELGYTGSTDDSATMNIWLHKEVMKKLAANGGKVPAELQ